MKMYFAQCFTSGLPVGTERRDIKAGSFLEAARMVCDEPLQTMGLTMHKRVRVWLQACPGVSMSFYTTGRRITPVGASERLRPAPARTAFDVFIPPLKNPQRDTRTRRPDPVSQPGA